MYQSTKKSKFVHGHLPDMNQKKKTANIEFPVWLVVVITLAGLSIVFPSWATNVLLMSLKSGSVPSELSCCLNDWTTINFDLPNYMTCTSPSPIGTQV